MYQWKQSYIFSYIVVWFCITSVVQIAYVVFSARLLVPINAYRKQGQQKLLPDLLMLSSYCFVSIHTYLSFHFISPSILNFLLYFYWWLQAEDMCVCFLRMIIICFMFRQAFQKSSLVVSMRLIKTEKELFYITGGLVWRWWVLKGKELESKKLWVLEPIMEQA